MSLSLCRLEVPINEVRKEDRKSNLLHPNNIFPPLMSSDTILALIFGINFFKLKHSKSYVFKKIF